jgi:hypothetical protein
MELIEGISLRRRQTSLRALPMLKEQDGIRYSRLQPRHVPDGGLLKNYGRAA